jgi:hypothetical protein
MVEFMQIVGARRVQVFINAADIVRMYAVRVGPNDGTILCLRGDESRYYVEGSLQDNVNKLP